MSHREQYSPSITDLLIATLGSARGVRRFHQIISEQKLNKYKESSIRVILSRLHSKGYVTNSNSGWLITKTGKKCLKKKNLPLFSSSPFKKKAPVNIIISFDIPETNRASRRWLRDQIKIFGYKMLQQSLWIGPGPLPKKFLEHLEELNIRKNIKTFKIARVNN